MLGKQECYSDQSGSGSEASDEFVYELRSINLFNLTPKQADSVLDGFSSFLNALSEPIELYVLQDEREVHAGGDVYSIPYKRYFIASPIRIDHLIPLIRTNFKTGSVGARARVAKAFPEVPRRRVFLAASGLHRREPRRDDAAWFSDSAVPA